MRLPVTNQPALGQPPMDGDEIRPRDAVAVEENAVVAARGEDGAVADLGGAEAAVFVPDMLEAAAESGLSRLSISRRSTRLEPSSATTTSKSRSVWPRERAQHRVERVFAVIGGDNDGNQLGHGHPLGGSL